MTSAYPKVAQFKTVEQLRGRLDELGLSLPVDDEILTAQAGSPLALCLKIGGFTVGNRWCI
ncbi:MAG: NADH:flavin oxidoreductase, partial [Planctomycetia bacterium]|nr:NADH:flavin oxidoreductase [Planctomycetia bacterium]